MVQFLKEYICTWLHIYNYDYTNLSIMNVSISIYLKNISENLLSPALYLLFHSIYIKTTGCVIWSFDLSPKVSLNTSFSSFAIKSCIRKETWRSLPSSWPYYLYLNHFIRSYETFSERFVFSMHKGILCWVVSFIMFFSQFSDPPILSSLKTNSLLFILFQLVSSILFTLVLNYKRLRC